MTRNKTVSFLLACATLATTIAWSGCKPASPPPAAVSFTQPSLYPEGLEYDGRNRRFLVTSLREGTVGQVKDNGSYAGFFEAPQMKSAIGIRLDPPRDRVLICNSDPGPSKHTTKETQGKLAGLAIASLRTGKLTRYIDLGALKPGIPHFCNDIALAADGTAFITDSFSPIIYKVTTDNKASVFLMDDRFVGKGFNLNGILDLGDFLLVAKYNEGLLFKIPKNDPKKFTQVKLAEKFPGADGLLKGPNGSVILAANASTNKIIQLKSSDNWASAKVVAKKDSGVVFATTGVMREGKTYILHAMLHVLFGGNKNPVSKFTIQGYDFN